MQNEINAVSSVAERDRMLDLFRQLFDSLPIRRDLSPEQRKSLVKMGDSGRPFVHGSLNLVEIDDTFMPRSFDKIEMRKDYDLYELLFPVYIQATIFYEALGDVLMLTGNDLMLAALDVYRNAKANGRGENLDELVPLLAQRFKRKIKKDDGDGNPPE